MSDTLTINKAESFEDFKSKYFEDVNPGIDIYELKIRVLKHSKEFEESLHSEVLYQANSYLDMIGEEHYTIEDVKKAKITSMWLPNYGQLELLQNQK